MRNKFLILLILVAVLFIIAGIIQFALGVFKVGFWAGVVLTVLVTGFIAFKLMGRNDNKPDVR
jgi:uncharacterized membrane protein YdjX (TVP38/TMEM64 family)